MGADHAAPPPLANAKSAFTRSWRRINLDFRCRTSPQEVGLLAYGRPASRPTSKMLRPWTRLKKTSPPWMATSARVVTAETPAMLAQRPRACADRAIRSARSPGGGAAARRRPIHRRRVDQVPCSIVACFGRDRSSVGGLLAFFGVAPDSDEPDAHPAHT